MEEEDFCPDDFGTGISVITIVMDDTEMAPRIDLGECPPHVAIVIFSKAIDALEQVIPFPTIEFKGKTIISEMYVSDDEDFND